MKETRVRGKRVDDQKSCVGFLSELNKLMTDKIKCLISFCLFAAPSNVLCSECNLFQRNKNVYDTSITITDVFS